MKYMFLILAGIATIFVGCNFFNNVMNDFEKAKNVASLSGRALGEIIKTTSKWSGNTEAQKVMSEVLNEIVNNIPEDADYDALFAKIDEIAKNYIDTKITDETKKAVAEVAVASLLSMVKATIGSLHEKYESQFEKGEKTYELVYAFLYNTAAALNNPNALFATKANDKEYLKVKASVEEVLKKVQ